MTSSWTRVLGKHRRAGPPPKSATVGSHFVLLTRPGVPTTTVRDPCRHSPFNPVSRLSRRGVPKTGATKPPPHRRAGTPSRDGWEGGRRPVSTGRPTVCGTTQFHVGVPRGESSAPSVGDPWSPVTRGGSRGCGGVDRHVASLPRSCLPYSSPPLYRLPATPPSPTGVLPSEVLSLFVKPSGSRRPGSLLPDPLRSPPGTWARSGQARLPLPSVPPDPLPLTPLPPCACRRRTPRLRAPEGPTPLHPGFWGEASAPLRSRK